MAPAVTYGQYYLNIRNGLLPSPYKHAVKCYVAYRDGWWRVIGHRWGDIPYHVGWERTWRAAFDRAYSHAKAGGLNWPVAPGA